MSKELIVSTGKHETRVAILEDDQLVEIFHEREKEYSLAGSIHKGRVTRVLPGMQSAFVDIGLERDAFLYVSDFFEDNDEYDAVVSTVEEKLLKLDKGGSIPAERPEAARPVQVSAEVVAASPAAAAPPASERRDGHREQRASGDRPAGDRPAGDRPAGDRPGGDKGGDRRGRRGRRRRGGGRQDTGGLPDSKFYTPGSDDEEAAEPETAVKEAAAPVASYAPAAVRAGRADEDFMVLPGESLAKYSAPESESEFEAEEQHAGHQEDQHDGHHEAHHVEETEQGFAAVEPEAERVAEPEAAAGAGERG